MSRNQDAKNRRQPRTSIRPGLEQLESRLVPAKVVTTILDTTNPSSPTIGSLRAAVSSNVPSDQTVEFNDYLFAASIGVTHNPTALAVGNFRGGGKVDVVTASRFTNSLSFSPDNGNGLGVLSQASTTFNSTFAAGGTITALEAVDLNGDLNTDLIMVQSDNKVYAATGNGNGTFAAPTAVATLGGTAAGLAVGDFNKDGKTDFAVALTGTTGKVVYAMGNGNGTFAAAQTVTLSGTGSGNLVSLAVGDVTGDGTDDVVSLSSAGVLTALPGVASGSALGTPVATAVTGSPFSYLALGDLNNDGRADALLVNSASGIISAAPASASTPGAFLTGTNISTITLSAGAAPGLLRVADLNADGKSDIAVTQYGLDNVAIYTGKGDGSFNLTPSTFDVVDPTDIRVRDMNGDGLPDLVCPSETSQSFAVFTNSGNASFSPVANKQATFILNGAVGVISDTLNNNLKITGGSLFGPGAFDANGNSLANLPRVVIQADVGFNQADYDLTNTTKFSAATTNRGSGFTIGDVIQQGITNTQGGARFQVLGVDAAGGITTLRVLQPGSQTVYDPFSATNTKIDSRLALASTTLSQSNSSPYFKLTAVSGTGTGLAFPTANLATTQRASGLFFQNTPSTRNLTLDGLSLRAAHDNSIIVTQGTFSITNSTMDDVDATFGTSRDNRHFISLQTGAGSLTVTNSRFENSRVDAINGSSTGTITITGSSFSNNDGQGLRVSAGTVTITDTTFTYNGDLESTISREIYLNGFTISSTPAASPPLGIGGSGGGRGMNAAGTVTAGTITVSNSVFDNNRHATIPSVDRSLYLGANTLSVSNSIFRNNTNNGALELSGTNATVTNSQFDNNASPLRFNTEWPTPAAAQGDRLRGGAAILIRDNTGLTLSLSKFTNNTVDNIDSRFSGGGAIHISSGTANISECAFEGNSVIITDYPNSGTPGFYNPETSPTARFSGGGALYAGGLTIIRDSYFTKNFVNSYVDIWNPSYDDNAAPTRTQFAGGGAVILARNLDSSITSDVFNTTFVGNFVQQVEANKDINGAGKQRLDSGIAYIPLDASFAAGSMQSVGINDTGTNKGQIVDGTDSVTSTALTTDTTTTTTQVTSSAATTAGSGAGNTGVSVTNPVVTNQDIPTTASAQPNLATYQLSGRYVTFSSQMTTPVGTSVNLGSLSSPWFQSKTTPLTGTVYRTTYQTDTVTGITNLSTSSFTITLTTNWNITGGQMDGTITLPGGTTQTFTGTSATSFTFSNSAATIRATGASYNTGSKVLTINLNAVPATTDVFSITANYATTGKSKVQDFKFDGTTFTTLNPPALLTPAATNFTYVPGTSVASLTLSGTSTLRYGADLYYPEGIISRIVHTSVSGSVFVGGTKVQDITSVTADGTLMLSSPGANATYALSGRLDLNTGVVSLVWNTTTPAIGALNITGISPLATSVDNGVSMTYRQSGIIDIAAADGDNDTDTDFAYINTSGNLQVMRNVRIEPASTNPFAYAAASGGTISLSGTPVSIAMGKMGVAGGVAVLRKTSTDNTGFKISIYLCDTSGTTPTWGSSVLSGQGNQTNPRNISLNLDTVTTPWTKIIASDVDGNGLSDIVAFNPGAGLARVFLISGPFTDGSYAYPIDSFSVDLLGKATAAVNTIFGADPNPYTSVSITDIGVTQLDASGNLDIAASVKLVSSDPSRPTDAVLMASGTADNLYFVKNNRLDVLDETMNIRSNQIYDFRLDEQSTNSGIDNSGKFAAAGSYLADPSRLSALGVLQPITFAPRADLLGKPLAGIIYADNNAIQRFFYDNAAGTFQFEKIGLPDDFVTSATLSGTGALTLNWNNDYGATHVAIRDAAFTNTVTEIAAITVNTVDPTTDTLTLAATAPATGTVVTLAGTGTATGLFVGNRYFVINTGTGTVKLAASLLDATTGKAVDITAIGTPAFTLIPDDKSVTFSPVGASFRSNTTNAYVPGSFSGFVYVNGTVVQGYTVGAGGALSFNQVNPSRYLAVATGSSYDVLTGILTLAWNRDISTVPVRASITNTLGTSVTDFAAIPTTTLYDNAQTLVTNGSVKGTIYAGNTAVQTFSTGNTTTEPTNTVAVVATDTSTTFAALAHPVSIYADNYISDITTTLTGTQFARGSILVNGQSVQSFTLDRASLVGNVCTINLGGTITPVASGTFNIVTRVLTINWAAGQAPAANVSVSLTYTTPDMIFNFTKVGNPSIFVTSATLDPINHSFSLVWNGNPDQSRIDYSFSPAETFTTSATANPAAGQFTITSDPVLGAGRYTTFRVLKNSVSTGSLNGTIYLGTTPIQTFEFSETGTLRLAEVGNPSLKVTGGLIDHATGTFTLFWNGDVSAASPNTIVAYRQAYGVGPVAVSGQNFLTANANLSNSTYYGSGAGFGVASGAANKLTPGSLPNMPSTGRGLNGGAILVSEGRQVTGLVTANEAARAGGLNVRVYNTTVVANSLINTWAMNTSNAFPNSTVLFDPTRGSRQNFAPGSNYYADADRTSTTYGLMGDSGGIFNDTGSGSVRLQNSAVVSNTGLAYYSVSVADALGFTGVARITQQDLAERPTAYGPGAFNSQGSTLYRPTASPGFNNGPTTGDLIQTDQQTNFDNFTLIDTDNFRSALLGPSISNAGSSQYQYSDTQQQKIKYLPLSRLSPGRDAGTALPGGLPYAAFTSTDIRGANRTVNNAIDIGAFEVQVASATSLLTATTPGQNGGNPVVVTQFEYGQPISLNFKSAWNDNVPPTAALTGNISVLRATDDKVLGVSAYGVPVNASDISTGKTAIVTFNPASAQYPTLLDIGTNALYGVFSGDINYATSQTNPFNIVINKASTAVTLNPLTSVNSGSAVTITGFVTTPLSQAPLTNEGSLLLEYKPPGAGAYTTVPSPALTLVSSSPNKYSFTYTVPAGTFNALGAWDIHAKFVAGGLNHYSNSDGDTFVSTTQDVVDQAKLAFQILDASKNVISSPATVAHFTSFYIRAILADGVDVTKRTGGIELLDSKSNTVFTFPTSDINLTTSTGNSTGLASQGIPDGTAVTYFDYLFSNTSASTSLALQADDKLSARYNGYPTPSTNFYLGATTATQTLDLPGIKATLDLSTALPFTTDPVSGAKTYQTTYGAPYTVTATLGNNGNPTANFNGGSVSLIQVLPAPSTTIGTSTVPTAPAANSFSGSFTNLTPRGAGIQQYDATYTGDAFNYDPLTTTNPIGILNVNVAKANVASTSLASPIYAAQGSKVTFTVNLSNTLGALPAGFSLPTGTVKFFANPSGGTPVLLGQTPNSDPTSGVYTFTYTTTAGGSYPITIDYSGDSNYLSLTNQPFGTLIVPTITLNLGGNPANVARGAMVNFTATVAPAGSPTEQPGDVTFTFAKAGTVTTTVVVPNSAAVAGVYTLSTQLGGSTLDLANGTYTVTASYAQGSGQYPNMTSASRTLNVGLSSSTTTLSPTTVSGQYRYGEDIALAATVAGAVGLPFVAPGSVSIFDGVTNLTPAGLAIAAANASSPASTTQTLNSSTLATALAVGAHNFQAKYSGDGANYLASNSAVQSVTVTRADTTSTLSGITPATGIVAAGSALILQVTVGVPAYVEANAARPTGTVAFATGGSTLGTAAVDPVTGVASLTINPSALGNFTFTATYSGDGNYNSSATGSTYTVAAVNFAPVAVGAQARNIIQRGEQLTLSASVTPAVGANAATPLGVVQFVIPGSTDTIVASVPYNPTAGGVYSTTIDTGNPAFNLPVGTYNLVAKYVPASGDAYPALVCPSQTLTVGRQSVTLAGALGSTTIVYGSTVVLTGASIDAGLGVASSIPFTAGQTVDMYDGQTLVAQIPFSNNFRVLNLPTTKLEAGVHNLQLRYAGDANYRPATLDLAPLTVTQAASNLTLGTSATSLKAGQPFTFTAQVSSPQLGLPSSPTGTVLFSVTLAGAQVAVGQVALSQLSQASFNFTPSAAGAFVVTATYSGDRNFSAMGATDSKTVVASALTMGAITPNVVNLGARIRLTALMAPAGDGLFSQNGTVDFILPNGTLVARATVADSQLTTNGRLYTKDVDTGVATNNLRAGSASIRAIYVPGNGDTYPGITTDSQSLVINKQTTDTILTATPLTGASFGTAVSFTMTTTPRVAAGSVETTIPFADGGSLSLFDGSTLLQRLPVSGSSATATFSIPALTGGLHNFTAVYSGDAINFSPSTSSVLTMSIAKASTTLSLSPSVGANIQVGTATKFTATLASAVNAANPTGLVQFTMGGTNIGAPVALVNGTASITYTATKSGQGALAATYLGDGNFASSTASANLQFRARQPFFVVASQAGSTFMTYDSKTGRPLSTFQPLGPRYAGGFRVATGDVSGDGIADLAYTTSTGSFVRLMDGRTGASLGGFYAYTTNFTKPVNIAIADINGDGRGDIITAPGGTGVAATVRVFSGLNYGLLFNKTVFNTGFKGGVSVAGGDVDGDGKADIICTPFSGGGPRVQVYSGANGALLRDQTLFATTSTSGYSVAADDLNRDGKADIILGGMSGAQQVVVSDGATGSLLGSFLPFAPTFTGGARVATVDDIDGDGIRDIIVATGPNGQSQVKRYSGRNLAAIDEFFAYATTNAARNKGLFVG